MSASAISFFAWAAFLLVVLVGLAWTARRSRGVDQEVEEVASKALPEIGEIAEKRHMQRFGRAPTNAPGANGTGSWYPAAKKRVVKHA